MKIVKYIFIILMISLLLIMPNVSMAGWNPLVGNDYNKDPITNPDRYDPTHSVQGEDDTGVIAEKAGKIMNVLFIIGVVTSVISLMIIGIKYMIGSVEEKAEYKKTMIPYLVGIFFIIGITTILKVLSNIVSDINI